MVVLASARRRLATNGSWERWCNGCMAHLSEKESFHTSSYEKKRQYDCKRCISKKNKENFSKNPLPVQASRLRKAMRGAKEAFQGEVTAADLRKCFDFWGSRCYVTERSAHHGTKLAVLVCDPGEPVTWRNVVPVETDVAVALGYVLPSALRDPWRAALLAREASAEASAREP